MICIIEWPTIHLLSIDRGNTSYSRIRTKKMDCDALEYYRLKIYRWNCSKLRNSIIVQLTAPNEPGIEFFFLTENIR